MDTNLLTGLEEITGKYTEMDIAGQKIHCPYWMNKIVSGKVTARGFANGKGTAPDIRRELESKLNQSHVNRNKINEVLLIKLAKRNRIGIDCSGLVYRILDEGIRSRLFKCPYKSLDEVFAQGIIRTNANMLTGEEYCAHITNAVDVKTGDLIRINNGKHVAMIVELNGNEIVYIHSHDKTEVRGVHLGKIIIKDINRPLAEQDWQEKKKDGINFAIKYFHPEKGDGIFRLKIFC